MGPNPQSRIANPSAVVLGAGNIGRGFIGQLFSESGYALTLVDIDETLLDALNARGSYTIRLATNDGTGEAIVGPVRALNASDRDAVARALARAAIGATAVGARALPHVAPLIAAGVARRAAAGLAAPLNLIVCENLKGASGILRRLVDEHLDAAGRDYATAHLGLVETVIGRMVPPPTPEMRARDPSLILVEPYAELPVDRRGFIGDIPPIVGMQPSDNFEAYTARKLYIHNCGHACLAYLGHLAGYHFGYEALADSGIHAWLLRALEESKAGIVAAYGVPPGWLDDHAADLLARFANRALGDTLLRLGRDPARKLAPDDRLVGAARLAERAGVRPDALARCIAAGYRFDPPDDPLAAALQRWLAAEGLAPVLSDVSGIQPGEALGQAVQEYWAALAP